MEILKSLFSSVLYVQLSPERVTLRNPKTGATMDEPPELAIARDPKPRIIGLGREALAHVGAPSVEVVNPFGHPRTLVGDFTAGEQLLKGFVGRLNGTSWMKMSPHIVLHPLGDPAGGYTQFEIRALHEMALGAGAREVTIWQGRTLTDDELLSGRFPAEGQVLA